MWLISLLHEHAIFGAATLSLRQIQGDTTGKCHLLPPFSRKHREGLELNKASSAAQRTSQPCFTAHLGAVLLAWGGGGGAGGDPIVSRCIPFIAKSCLFLLLCLSFSRLRYLSPASLYPFPRRSHSVGLHDARIKHGRSKQWDQGVLGCASKVWTPVGWYVQGSELEPICVLGPTFLTDQCHDYHASFGCAGRVKSCLLH